MLQPRPGAGFAWSLHLLVRVHVLRTVRERAARRHLPELRRRACRPAETPCHQPRRLPGIDNKAGVQAGRLFRRPIRAVCRRCAKPPLARCVANQTNAPLHQRSPLRGLAGARTCRSALSSWPGCRTRIAALPASVNGVLPRRPPGSAEFHRTEPARRRPLGHGLRPLSKRKRPIAKLDDLPGDDRVRGFDAAIAEGRSTVVR